MTDHDEELANAALNKCHSSVVENLCSHDTKVVAEAIGQARREGELAMRERSYRQAKWKGKIGHIKVHSYEAGVVDGRNEASSEIIRLEPETPEVVK